MFPDPLDTSGETSFLDGTNLHLPAYYTSMRFKTNLSLVSKRWNALVKTYQYEFVWISRAVQAKALAHTLLLEFVEGMGSSGRFIRRLHIETPVLERCAPADLHVILEYSPQLAIYTDHQSIQRNRNLGLQMDGQEAMLIFWDKIISDDIKKELRQLEILVAQGCIGLRPTLLAALMSVAVIFTAPPVPVHIHHLPQRAYAFFFDMTSRDRKPRQRNPTLPPGDPSRQQLAKILARTKPSKAKVDVLELEELQLRQNEGGVVVVRRRRECLADDYGR
ncbi:hypothetical protein EWM64_g7832 [Hericium alpestre]|uniref:F-box domain-containing protein n=1 Tax=Hericium alpestre TaxID=135208 RepID=A0A4Y9ZPK2_9AGAM|nr:hypothetical protein EWM64_g7832 [Hericium alpestre]